MTFDELVELLERRQWPTFPSSGGSFQTFCPICEGDGSNSPSLNVKRTRDGGALLYCFSGKGGCGLDGERDWELVEAVFEAFGTASVPRGAGRRWRSRGGSGSNPGDSGAVEVARYDYGDGHVKVRYEWPDGWRKDFRWRPRKPGPRLYMPPDDESRWAFLVEGEKDVDSLREIGLQATAPAEGHLTEQLAKKLRGFHVAVLHDYDLHGRRARDAAMGELLLAGIHAVAVELPGLEEVESRGEDVTDWLGAGGSRTELEELVARADAGSSAGEPEVTQDAPQEQERASGDQLGWRYHAGRMQEKRGTKWLDTPVRFNVIPHEMLVDEDGQVRGFDVTFEGAGPTPVRMDVPTTFLHEDKRAQLLSRIGGPDMIPAHAGVVAELLATFQASAGQRRRPVLTRAEWVGDELHVPGPVEVSAGRRELAKYGDAADVAEEEAQGLWREVVYEALGWPKLVVALGFPLGSLYVEKVKRQRLFTVHITGESHTGKSESASIAMAALGDSEVQVGRLYRSWDMSAKAPGNVLKELGVMPAWFDEAANLETTPEGFEAMLFHLMEGKSRTIAGNAGANVTGDETWTACALSTGEDRLTENSGLTGFRRRVMELHAPLTKDEDAHGRMLEAAMAAHGWPICWLAADPRPAEFVDLQFRLFTDLSPTARGQQVELAQAGNVALCVAGFAQLARTCGAEVGYDELLEAATGVFEKLMLSGAEEGSDVGERGLKALAEAVRTSGRFPRADELEFFTGERWGTVLEDGVVGVFGQATLKRVLEEFAGITDELRALAKWDDMGRLTKTKGLGYQTRRSVFDPVRGKQAQTKMYVVRLGASPR